MSLVKTSRSQSAVELTRGQAQQVASANKPEDNCIVIGEVGRFQILKAVVRLPSSKPARGFQLGLKFSTRQWMNADLHKAFPSYTTYVAIKSVKPDSLAQRAGILTKDIVCYSRGEEPVVFHVLVRNQRACDWGLMDEGTFARQVEKVRDMKGDNFIVYVARRKPVVVSPTSSIKGPSLNNELADKIRKFSALAGKAKREILAEVKADTKKQFAADRDAVLASLPAVVTKSFFHVGFAKFGTKYHPVLFLNPYNVPPGAVRDLWLSKYETRKDNGTLQGISCLVYWYGETDLNEQYSLVPQHQTMTWNEGKAKNLHTLPANVQKKLDSERKLNNLDRTRIRAQKELEEDLRRKPSGRHVRVQKFQEIHELISERDLVDMEGDLTTSEKNDTAMNLQRVAQIHALGSHRGPASRAPTKTPSGTARSSPGNAASGRSPVSVRIHMTRSRSSMTTEERPAMITKVVYPGGRPETNTGSRKGGDRHGQEVAQKKVVSATPPKVSKTRIHLKNISLLKSMVVDEEDVLQTQTKAVGSAPTKKTSTRLKRRAEAAFQRPPEQQEISNWTNQSQRMKKRKSATAHAVSPNVSVRLLRSATAHAVSPNISEARLLRSKTNNGQPHHASIVPVISSCDSSEANRSDHAPDPTFSMDPFEAFYAQVEEVRMENEHLRIRHEKLAVENAEFLSGFQGFLEKLSNLVGKRFEQSTFIGDSNVIFEAIHPPHDVTKRNYFNMFHAYLQQLQTQNKEIKNVNARLSTEIRQWPERYATIRSKMVPALSEAEKILRSFQSS